MFQGKRMPGLFPDLMRGEFSTCIHIYQLEEQSKVLVAVCDECALGLGWVGHPERDIYTVNLSRGSAHIQNRANNANFTSFLNFPLSLL